MESGFKCGSGEPGSSFCVMMDILYHVPHLCGGFFAIFNELNSKTNNINGHILISFVNATDTIKIQTKFDSIPTSGAMRQSIFMFGTANGTTVYGMITLFSNTPLNSRWDGVGKVGVNIDSNGIVTITLPQTSYDRFILISSEKIAGL